MATGDSCARYWDNRRSDTALDNMNPASFIVGIHYFSRAVGEGGRQGGIMPIRFQMEWLAMTSGGRWKCGGRISGGLGWRWLRVEENYFRWTGGEGSDFGESELVIS